MSKITIGKKEYEVSEVQLNQCELLFYEENPLFILLFVLMDRPLPRRSSKKK